MPAIPVLKMLRQKELEFMARLAYVVRPSLLKKKTKTKQNKTKNKNKFKKMSQ